METPAHTAPPVVSTDLLASLPVGSRIWFAEESRPYRVRATDGRFHVCTKPFNPRKTVLYCVFDTQTMMRAPENLIFGHSAETDEQCQEMLNRINGSDPEMKTELSRRHGIPAKVIRFVANVQADLPATVDSASGKDVNAC